MNTMKRAHEIRKAAAKKWNCKKSEIIFSICLKMAWTETKENNEMEELKRKMVEYDNTHNEGQTDSYNPYRDQLIALQNKIHDAKDITWTKEVTIARRQEWKEWVIANAKGGKVSAAKISKQITKQGWNLEALKRAIKQHNL